MVSSFINSGAGLVLSMVCFSSIVLNSEKQIYNCGVGVEYNERMNQLCVYRCLLIIINR